MKEIVYKYNSGGMYTTEDDTCFKDCSEMKIIVEPHEFSLSIGKEVLRSSCYSGGSVVVCQKGSAVFYDSEDNVTAKAERGEKEYKEVRFSWKQDLLTVTFGHKETVDYYPNCDGEHDRWGCEWIAERSVTLNLKDGTTEIK